MIWIFLGLLHSVFRAAFVETGRIFGGNRWQRAFSQSLFGLLILLPAAFFVPWPTDPHFYLAATGVALIFTVGTLIQLELSLRQSGRVSSMYMPLEALLAVIIWAAIYPPVWQSYFDNPVASGVLAFGFVLASVALLRLRRQDISWYNFSLVAPIGLTYAVAGVVTKIALPAIALPGIAVSFVIVSFAVKAVLLGLVLRVKKEAIGSLFARQKIAARLVAGLFSVGAFGSFVLGVAYAPNPGYISALAMLLPIWLLGWHKMRQIEDPADKRIAALVVCGLVLFLISAHLLH